MGFPQNVYLTPEEEAALDAAVDEYVAEAEAKRRQERQGDEPDRSGSVVPLPDGEPPPTEQDLARLEEAARFWDRPDVRRILEQWNPYADIAYQEPDKQE